MLLDWLSLVALALPSIGDPPGLLTSRYPPERVATVLSPRDTWRPFPRVGDPAWGAVPQPVRAMQIAAAEDLLGRPWKSLPASVFLDYARNGDRSRYQALCFERRQRLATLVLAELFEDQGRFLDDVVDGVWLVCEETYWGVPAHVGVQERGSGLPDVTEPTVDLFAAETSALLAWTHYLLHERLDAVSTLVRERIAWEIQRRILIPCREREDFWWMGYGGRSVNNWNPWICSNWLTCALWIEEDPGQRARDVSKILLVLDHFLTGYPADGGCDEGPGYWSRAGGSLFDSLELLASASGGAIDVFDAPLVREIGRFIQRVHIADEWFVNFADASARMSIDAPLVFRYGRAIDDPALARFAAAAARRQRIGEEALSSRFGGLGRSLEALRCLPELLAEDPADALLRDVWLPDLEVMLARETGGSTRGFTVAAKGGHNAESHNHNDVGNVIVFHDGQPVLVDAGVGEYTRQTFSSRRYEIWTMQSAFHNLPTPNGVQQHAGRGFRAREVTYRADDVETVLAIDLAGAYPGHAHLRELVRHVRLDREHGRVTLRDRFALEKIEGPSTWNLLTACAVEVQADRVLLRRDEGGPITLRAAPRELTVRVEPIEITDAKLARAWPSGLTRLVFELPEDHRDGEVEFTLAAR